MRILFISQLFDPENAIKGLSFAKALAAAGHDVDVITAFPSYPGGKLYPGHRQQWRKVERHGPGLSVTRVPTYISHGPSGLKRLLGYASFSTMAFLHGLFAKRPDVIYAYYPPIVGGLGAVTLGALRRVPAVYDVQDLWPEAVVASGMVQEGWLTRFIERLAGIIYRRSTCVVTQSDGYRKALVDKGVPSVKLVRIYNWCDESRIVFFEGGRDQDSAFNVVYAGNLGAAQGLESVIEAAAIVEAQGCKDIRFDFIGDGVQKSELQAQVLALGLQNVRFIDKVPPEQIGDFLSNAGALIAHLRSDPVFDITVPQKVQAYLLAGRPLLMAVGGESAEVVLRAQAGITAPPCDPEGIAAAAISLSRLPEDELRAMGIRGRSFYEQHMSQQNGVRQTLELLEKLAGGAE